MLLNLIRNNYFKIFLIFLISCIIDSFLIISINSPPAWDQGYHLSNVFKMYNILDLRNLNLFNQSNLLLDITDSYRGPLTYFLSAIFLKVFNNSYYFAYLSNQIFNLICIFSIFYLGKIFRNSATGIWASIIFTFSTLIINQRADHLIDLSLTSFSTLNLLFITKWYFDKKKNSKFSIFSGISLGLVFLTKPTGIILFLIPICTIIFKRHNIKNNLIKNTNEIIFFIIPFILLIFPWFSRHWLTISTSIINAWNWGINYQDGFEKKSLKNWLFYFYKFPEIFGQINFSIISIIYLFEKLIQKNLFKIKVLNIRKINFWFLIYLLNCYLILSIMSTKDIRFIMPLYPIICIYLADFICTKNINNFSAKNKKLILAFSLCLSFIFNKGSNLFILGSETFSIWPHSQIIEEIKNQNINLNSTLAVLPDTGEVNTFNLEAEAARQGEYVSVRQVISNIETYKEDLEYFDWFLAKTGYQGIMTSESKDLLNQYLLKNNSFVIHKEWLLPDNSKLMLLRRKLLNTYLTEEKCIQEFPDLEINTIKNGININLSSRGESMHSSSLLIDFISEDIQKLINISLANNSYNKDFKKEKCYNLSQDLSLSLPKSTEREFKIKTRLLNKDGNIKPLKTLYKNLKLYPQNDRDDLILMTNKISKVELLGNYLREGKFKYLFDLVGIINQSDPKQNYLKDAEKIYSQRYEDNKNIQDLYSILISQILQRKVFESEKTLDLIMRFDRKNGNAFLTKSLLNIYKLDGKNARIYINKANLLKQSSEGEEILKILDGITYILELKFINAYNTFT